MHLLSKPKVQIVFLRSMVCITMNLKIPSVIYGHHIYIKECSSFITSNRYNWKIRCHINCHDTTVLYFSSCVSSNGNTTYTGKTVNYRYRMNNHLTVCGYGISTNRFENHVFKCSNKNKHVWKEPYFKVYTFITVSNENKLWSYESYFT